MLCFACAEIKSPQEAVPEVWENIVENATVPKVETPAQDTEVPTEEDTTEDSPSFGPATVDEELEQSCTEEVGRANL